MSKQLTISATASTLAMAALALCMSVGGDDTGSRGPTTAHGSLVSVLLRV